MSSHQFTGRADADTLDVFLYGLTEFGTAQAERYQGILEHAFQVLADNPRMGRAAAAIGVGAGATNVVRTSSSTRRHQTAF